MKKETESFVVHGHFGQADLFLRDQPVSAQFPEGIGELVREVIDHGGFVLSNLRFQEQASPSRRMVITAIFRRVLITAEAVRVLTNGGLEEPAIATVRTLSELERDLRLVVNDPTDRMARRLIYFYAVRGRRHFRKVTTDAETRELFQEDMGLWDWAREMSRFFKDQLSSDDFEDIREECTKARYWHGFKNQKEAFEAAGMSHDYHTLFDSASSFVHGSNVDHDVAEAGEGVKGCVQRDPATAFTRLAYVASNLTVLFGLVLEAAGQGEGYGPTAVLVGDDETREDISAFEFLQARVLSVLETGKRDLESKGAADAQIAVAEAFTNRAMAILRSGQLHAALGAFAEVVTRFAEERSPEVEACVGAALLNMGYLHGKLGEPAAAIAAYDEAVRRFGDSPIRKLRVCVAMCLRNKGSTLAEGSLDAARAAWDDLVERFIDEQIPEIQVEVATALVKKAGSAITEGNYELAIMTCDMAVDRHGNIEDGNVLRQVALAIELKGMAQNQLGLPGEALATHQDLVDRFGSTEGDRGLPVSWRAMGIKIMALTLLGDTPGALRTFRRLCSELDIDNQAMLHKLVWDTIDTVAKGASPGSFADVLTPTAKRSDVLVPVLAALRKLAGCPMQVPEDISQRADEVIRQIKARTQ